MPTWRRCRCRSAAVAAVGDRQSAELGVAGADRDRRGRVDGMIRLASWWYQMAMSGRSWLMKATIACVSGSLAGPVPAYWLSPGCADRSPARAGSCG